MKYKAQKTVGYGFLAPSVSFVVRHGTMKVSHPQQIAYAGSAVERRVNGKTETQKKKKHAEPPSQRLPQDSNAMIHAEHDVGGLYGMLKQTDEKIKVRQQYCRLHSRRYPGHERSIFS